MVRNYKTPLGARNYSNYESADVDTAVQLIRNRKISQCKASREYGISRGTLQNRIKEHANAGSNINNNSTRVGHPTALSMIEEESIKEHVLVLSKYGLPLTSFDLRCLVKSHQDKNNKTVKCFKNNFPGKEWALSFVRRHTDLTQRFAANIKVLRAKVSPETISSYCDNLIETLNGVPPCNTWNFDETDLTDDPGQKKVITKRCKYPERIMNSSKASISVMFCANGIGVIMPPYVVYKSVRLWNTWIMGGPKGSRYNRSKSGWFDSVTFEDWFVSVALPILKAQEGRKVLIRDNLSSHFSKRVLELCEEHNICFVSLPPNSTHLTQPLDVAFFRSLKMKWREILDEYRTKFGGAILAKDQFPRLLSKLMTEMEQKASSIVSGFRKCGICPVDKDQLLARLPHYDLNDSSSSNDSTGSVSESVLEFLNKQRYTDKENNGKVRKKKINVEPGKSIQSTDVQPLAEKNVQSSSNVNKRGGAGNQKRPKASKVPKKTADQNAIVSCSESVDSPSSEESDLSEVENDTQYNHEGELQKFGYVVGSFVIVEYEDEYFPGEVKNVDLDGSAEVSTMSFSGENFIWPQNKDQIWYEKKQIKEVIQRPNAIQSKTTRTRKNVLCVPEILKYRPKS